MRFLTMLRGTDPVLRRVLPHAAALASATDSELVVAHVVPAAEWERRGAEEAALQRLLAKEGLSGRALVFAQRPGQRLDAAIVRAADEAGADLVAMTCRHHGPVQHLIGRSVTMGVLGRSTAPMLVASQAADDVAAPRRGQYRMVIACDLTPSDSEAIRAIAPIVEQGTIDVGLLHVYIPRPGDASKQEELEARHRAVARLRGLLPATTPVEVLIHSAHEWERAGPPILRTARAYGAGVIVLATRGHSASRHLLLGSTAMELLGTSPLPLILVRA